MTPNGRAKRRNRAREDEESMEIETNGEGRSEVSVASELSDRLGGSDVPGKCFESMAKIRTDIYEIEHKALLGAVNRVRIMDGGRNGGWFIDRFSDEEWEKLVDAILGKYKDA